MFCQKGHDSAESFGAVVCGVGELDYCTAVSFTEFTFCWFTSDKMMSE